MAYTPKTWACDDTITADDLNHIEQGIAENSGGTALIIRVERTESCPEGYEGEGITYYNATYQQVKDAYDAGIPVYAQIQFNDFFFRYSLASVGFVNDIYEAVFATYDRSTDSVDAALLIASTPTEELHIGSCNEK